MPGVGAYRAGSFVARHLPSAISHPTVRIAAHGVSLSDADRRTIVRRNLERSLGRRIGATEEQRLVGEVFEWYARYYLESFQLPGKSAEEIDRGFEYVGFDHIEDSQARGNGTILAMPHLGCWEWAAFWLSLVPDMRVTAVVEPLDPPELFDWFADFRRSLGMHVIALGPEAGRGVVAALKRNEIVCLLSDRDIAGNGVAVDFFGERTRIPAGPATLALRTGAGLISVGVTWQGEMHRAVVEPLEAERHGKFREDVTRVSQAIAHRHEELIRMAPTQWHVMNPNWPSDYVAIGQPVPDTLQDLD